MFVDPKAFPTGRYAALVASAAILLAALAPSAPAAGEGVADYRILQLMQHPRDDRLARVSDGHPPLLVWMGRWALPEAQSGSFDFEIMRWDGHTLEQLTDDPVNDHRAVVNSKREVAWMKPGIDAASEIYTRYRTEEGEVVHRRITNDSGNEMRDRYPDINDDGIVTWGRGRPATFAVYETGTDSIVWKTSIRSYRPHINSLGHIVRMDGAWVRNRFGNLISTLDSEAFGYDRFNRTELNNRDELLIEAIEEGPLPSTEGRRDMLFWDGSEMRLIYQSDVFAGRGDLNDDGVAAFEGRGGLSGAVSGSLDLEVFVYIAEQDALFQLTDNDIEDRWPTVTADGTIVWESQGNWEGATRGAFTGHIDAKCCEDIMLALPLQEDFDADGVPNAFDNCAVTYNAAQADADGNGVGDACDGSCNGFMQVRDCSQSTVNPGRLVSDTPSVCGGGQAGLTPLAPLFLAAAWRHRRRRSRRECGSP